MSASPESLPVLILLPGLDGTGLLFANFVAALGDKIETKILSYPTDKIEDYAQAEAFVLAHLADNLKQRRYVVLGESFSGPVALAIAATPPPGLAGIVLCATFAKNPRPLLGAFKHLAAHLPVERIPMAVFEFLLFGAYGSKRDHQDLRRAFAALQPKMLRKRIQAVLNVDYRARLAAIRVPALYLRSEDDRLVPPRCADTVATQMPNLQIASFNAPHLVLQVRPQEAATAVLDFVTQIEKNQSAQAPASLLT